MPAPERSDVQQEVCRIADAVAARRWSPGTRLATHGRAVAERIRRDGRLPTCVDLQQELGVSRPAASRLRQDFLAAIREVLAGE